MTELPSASELYMTGFTLDSVFDKELTLKTKIFLLAIVVHSFVALSITQNEFLSSIRPFTRLLFKRWTTKSKVSTW